MKRNSRKFRITLKGIGRWIFNAYRYVGMHWPRFLLSMITATFTWQAAFILTGAVYYAVMAVLLAEGMFLYWLSRIEAYENFQQQIVAGLLFFLSCAAIAATDIASAVLIVHQNDTAEFYKNVPAWVEQIVTNVTPVLAASNLVAYGLFEFMSDTNRDRREHASRTRNVERIVKASKRDVARLKARVAVLRVHKRLSVIERRHNRVFGETLVAKVNDLMKLELLSRKGEERVSLFSTIKTIVGGLFSKKVEEVGLEKRKYKRKNK